MIIRNHHNAEQKRNLVNSLTYPDLVCSFFPTLLFNCFFSISKTSCYRVVPNYRTKKTDTGNNSNLLYGAIKTTRVEQLKKSHMYIIWKVEHAESFRVSKGIKAVRGWALMDDFHVVIRSLIKVCIIQCDDRLVIERLIFNVSSRNVTCRSNKTRENWLFDFGDVEDCCVYWKQTMSPWSNGIFFYKNLIIFLNVHVLHFKFNLLYFKSNLSNFEWIIIKTFGLNIILSDVWILNLKFER